MSFFNILLLAFVLVMYCYLWLIGKEIEVAAARKKSSYIAVGLFALLVGSYLLAIPQDINTLLQGGLSLLIVLSFLFDKRGLTEEKIIVNSMDRKGVPYNEIEKIYLYKAPDKSLIRMNYFRKGLRGPILSFSLSVEELLQFLSEHLPDEVEVNIYTED